MNEIKKGDTVKRRDGEPIYDTCYEAKVSDLVRAGGVECVVVLGNMLLPVAEAELVEDPTYKQSSHAPTEHNKAQ